MTAAANPVAGAAARSGGDAAGGQRYRSLQALRGMAALMVVLYHLGVYTAQPKYFGIGAIAVPFSFGHAGVEFFFVLSGFIIARAHRADVFRPARLPTFLLKRFFRIYPTYWVVFLVVYVGALVLGNQSETLPRTVWVLVKSLLLLPQDPAVVGGTGAPVIWVAWTLQYEMYFYAWCALVIAGRAWLLTAAALLGAAVVACQGDCGFAYAFATSGFLLHFLAGVLMALVAERVQLTRRVAAGVGAAGLLLFVGAALSEVLHTPGTAAALGGWAYAPSAALMVLAAVQLEDAGRVVGSWRWLQHLGDASYSLYLIHQPIMALLFPIVMAMGIAGLGGALLAWLLIFAACIAAGLALHGCVERPILRRCSLLLNGGRRRPAGP